jgi:3-(3-hydroxy-phenyl)propionate hydroxylase
MKTYTNPVYPFRRPPELDAAPRTAKPGAPATPAAADVPAAGAARRPVVIVGAGPVGLAAAIDLAQRGVPVVVLDDDDTVSVGSRAICYAKRALEILDRLGCGDPVADKGVRWNVGKVFHHDELVYSFDLLPETGHRRPAFVNLQQYWLEQYLVERTQALPAIDLRWKSRVSAVAPAADGVTVTVETPEGTYTLACDWLVACDGARSPVRTMLGLESEGQVFRDRFLIADIHMQSGFPPERWFWFDPPFHPNQSVLLHRQADDVWRIDFQLGWDADPDEEKKPERILPRLRAMLGPDARFDIEWASVYTFQCRRMAKFRHGRVLFAGDAAHLVSPFGARGANSGFQDVDNLCWKLSLVLAGRAPERLLDSYDVERTAAADENILNSTRATDFITPKSAVSRTFRDAVLQLAKRHPFARRLVNSGRLSVPRVHVESPLNTPDGESFTGSMVPGAPAADAPVHGPLAGPAGRWFLPHLEGGFTLAVFGAEPPAAAVAALAADDVACRVIVIAPPGVPDAASPAAPAGTIAIADTEGLLAARYDGQRGTAYLFRPDQHVCARWRGFDRAFDLAAVRAAIAHATARR